MILYKRIDHVLVQIGNSLIKKKFENNLIGFLYSSYMKLTIRYNDDLYELFYDKAFLMRKTGNNIPLNKYILKAFNFDENVTTIIFNDSEIVGENDDEDEKKIEQQNNTNNPFIFRIFSFDDAKSKAVFEELVHENDDAENVFNTLNSCKWDKQKARDTLNRSENLNHIDFDSEKSYDILLTLYNQKCSEESNRKLTRRKFLKQKHINPEFYQYPSVKKFIDEDFYLDYTTEKDALNFYTEKLNFENHNEDLNNLISYAKNKGIRNPELAAVQTILACKNNVAIANRIIDIISEP